MTKTRHIYEKRISREEITQLMQKFNLTHDEIQQKMSEFRTRRFLAKRQGVEFNFTLESWLTTGGNFVKRPRSEHRNQSWWRAYSQQRGNADIRGIEWKIKPLEWWMLWQTSGKWKQRGRQRDQYCMARFNDSGPYSIDNVMIVTNAENHEMTVPVPHTAEFKRAMSERMKGHKYGVGRRYSGHVVTTETRLRISKAGLGRKHTVEAKAKISAGLMGHIVSRATRQKLREAGFNRVFSIEIRARMSKSRQGRKHTQETKTKIAKALRKYRRLTHRK